MFEKATFTMSLAPLMNVPLPPQPVSTIILAPTIKRANLDIMVNWFTKNYPNSPTTKPLYPFLRSISGPNPSDSIYWDWSGMLHGHMRNHHLTNDVATTMKCVAQEAIIYGINCHSGTYKMPESCLAKYNDYFMTFLASPKSKL